MRSLVITLFVGAILGVGFWPGVLAQPSEEYLTETLDILVSGALQAYNSEDSFKFFEYFAKEMLPITTKRHFKAEFIKIHKKNLGDFHFRKLIREDSTLDPDYPILVYQGEFEKYDNVLIVVNFAREYDNYRIERIRFDKVFPEQAMDE